MPKSLAIDSQQKVKSAIKNGLLVRPETCQLCGWEQSENADQCEIFAHHWNGYDKPLDVWFICRSCNAKLEKRHDGSLTIEEAKCYVSDEFHLPSIQMWLEQRRTCHPNIKALLRKHKSFIIGENQMVYSTPGGRWEVWENFRRIAKVDNVRKIIKTQEELDYEMRRLQENRTTKVTGFSLRDMDRRMIADLVESGYAPSGSAVIRKAIRLAARQMGIEINEGESNGQ